MASLDKIEKQVKKGEAEAKRRQNVAEAKAWGACMEIIDKLRDENKGNSAIYGEIKEIKKDIKEIKDLVRGQTPKIKELVCPKCNHKKNAIICICGFAKPITNALKPCQRCGENSLKMKCKKCKYKGMMGEFVVFE